MPIHYNLYANDGRGGDVDYTSPLATVAGLSFAVGPLAAPSDNTIAVRALDVASGIEEANTDARVRVVIDPSGNDITARPNAVRGFSARRTSGGTCRLTWGYDEAGEGGPPSRFDVSTTPGLPGPAGPVVAIPGVVGYGCSLAGLAAGTRYMITVRAIGSSDLLASEPASVSIDYRLQPLSGVDSLAAVASP